MSELRRRLRVDPGTDPLRDRDPADLLDFDSDDDARAHLPGLRDRLADLQYRLEAEGEQAMLVLLQGMDGAGKDETIREAMQGLNPQQQRVESFGPPGDDDLAHDFLWRFHHRCPLRGEIGVFNRSWYECVVADRVAGAISGSRLDRRFEHITAFERMLRDEGTHLVKVLLHLSKDEQRRRLQARLDQPDRHWEFDAEDLEDRRRWDEHHRAYGEALRATSTRESPWYIVPADNHGVRNAAVLSLMISVLEEEADPRIPPRDPGLDEVEIPD